MSFRYPIIPPSAVFFFQQFMRASTQMFLRGCGFARTPYTCTCTSRAARFGGPSNLERHPRCLPAPRRDVALLEAQQRVVGYAMPEVSVRKDQHEQRIIRGNRSIRLLLHRRGCPGPRSLRTCNPDHEGIHTGLREQALSRLVLEPTRQHLEASGAVCEEGRSRGSNYRRLRGRVSAC